MVSAARAHKIHKTIKSNGRVNFQQTVNYGSTLLPLKLIRSTGKTTHDNNFHPLVPNRHTRIFTIILTLVPRSRPTISGCLASFRRRNDESPGPSSSERFDLSLTKSSVCGGRIIFYRAGRGWGMYCQRTGAIRLAATIPFRVPIEICTARPCQGKLERYGDAVVFVKTG